MLFDDLAHDGQAQSGPGVARGHIGFKQAGAVLGQADPVVRDGNFTPLIEDRQPDVNLRIQIFWRIFFL